MLKIWSPHTCHSVRVLLCYTPPSACSNNDTTVRHTRSGLFSSRISDGVQSFSYKIKSVFRTIKHGRNMRTRERFNKHKWKKGEFFYIFHQHWALCAWSVTDIQKRERFLKSCTLLLPHQKKSISERTGAQPFMKWVKFVCEWNFIFLRKDGHQDSLWERGILQFGNDLL